MLQLSPQENIDTILIRYVSLLSEPEVINNKHTKNILNKIVTDLLSDQVLLVQKEEFAEYSTTEKDPFSDYMALKKFKILIAATNIKLSEIKDIDERTKQVVSSILNIIKAPIKIDTTKIPDISDVIHEIIRDVGGKDSDSSR